MKYALLVLALSFPGWHWLGHIRARNDAVAQAQTAYRTGHPQKAAADFQRAVTATSGRAADPRLLVNLGLAQTQAGLSAAARTTYGQLLSMPGVPAALGSTARQQLAVLVAGQGNFVQALSLLRQALLLDPENRTARYNYEVLREFMAQQPSPQIPPPAMPTPTKPKPDETEKKEKSPAPTPKGKDALNQPAGGAGSDRTGQANTARQPAPPAGAPQARPAAAGQPDPSRPAPSPGTAAAGGFQPGDGQRRPLPTGAAGGPERGLSADKSGSPARAGQSGLPGIETATNADQQFQTQRERLRQLNLTPGQAHQLLEALRAQEQQYLQQRPRPAGRAAKPGQPTW